MRIRRRFGRRRWIRGLSLGSELSDADVDPDDLGSALSESDDEVVLEDAEGPDDDASMADDNEAIDSGEDDDALLGSDDEVARDLNEALKNEVQFSSEKTAAVPPEEKRGKEETEAEKPAYGLLRRMIMLPCYMMMMWGTDGVIW